MTGFMDDEPFKKTDRGPRADENKRTIISGKPQDAPTSRPPRRRFWGGKRKILVALTVAAVLLFSPAAPADAHGGDGRTAPCAVPNARTASWGCGSAFTTSGDFIYANVTDRVNDGHCITVMASHPHSSGTFNIGRVCPLGGNHQIARRVRISGDWNRVWITNGHRYMTLCGRGSGRTC